MVLGVIPTGSLGLDFVLGTGGVPRGQITLITGGEASGKSTLCLHIIAEAQRLGGICAYIDADHSLDPAYADLCGVDPESVYVVEPNHAEQALDILEILTSSKVMSVIVLDSVTALVPQVELQRHFDQGDTLASDPLLSRFLHHLRHLILEANTTLLFTDRAYTRLSSVYHGLAVNPARQALKLAAATHINLQRTVYRGSERRELIIPLEVRIIKNKFCPGFRSLKLELFCKNGMINIREILDLALKLQLIRREGDNYRFGSLNLGTTYQEVTRVLESNPQIEERIEQLLRKELLTTAEQRLKDFTLRSRLTKRRP